MNSKFISKEPSYVPLYYVHVILFASNEVLQEALVAQYLDLRAPGG